jgi:hypothetical protein
MADSWNRAIALALIGTFLLVAVPSGAQADSPGAAPMQVSYSVPNVQVTRAANHDWLAKRKPIASVTLVAVQQVQVQIGKGSWICSPAGFGKKSRCYSN